MEKNVENHWKRHLGIDEWSIETYNYYRFQGAPSHGIASDYITRRYKKACKKKEKFYKDTWMTNVGLNWRTERTVKIFIIWLNYQENIEYQRINCGVRERN